MKELFCEDMTINQINQLPTLTLAHVGDGVYELLARTYVVEHTQTKVFQAHKNTVAIVCAAAQEVAAKAILPMLSEEELPFFQRGRNSKPHSTPKHASVSSYAYATGLEALFGMLYLNGRRERIGELWQTILEGRERENENI